MADYPTFAYQDEKIIAFHGNQVIAHGKDFAKVAETAEEYFSALRKAKKREKKEAKRAQATHIVSPNGIKGQIISRVAGLWGDEITVRLENGQIRSFVTAGADDGLEYVTEASENPSSYAQIFQSRMDEGYNPDIAGLTARINDLSELRHEASIVIASTKGYPEQVELHQIVMAAQAEQAELKDRLDHLLSADAESMLPPAPFRMQAAEQASLGGHDGSWLEVVAQEMIAESEAQDFDKLMIEGPTLFTSSLDDGALADKHVVREMAMAHITAKTAGFQGEEVEEYRKRFVAATEVARNRELTYRHEDPDKPAKKAHKEAKHDAKVIAELPDEFLW